MGEREENIFKKDKINIKTVESINIMNTSK